MENLGVLIFVIMESLFLLGIMAGAIIAIVLTRKKKNNVEKIIHYVGIGVLCIVGITLLPLLLSFVGDLIIIGAVVLVAIWYKRRKN